jgi:hypothetical protein
MLNDSCFGFSSGVSVDWLSSRFIAFGLPAGQDEKGQSDCLALPCCIAAQQRSSRSSALLYPLLGIGILSPLFVHDKNGLLFNNKVGTFLIIILM